MSKKRHFPEAETASSVIRYLQYTSAFWLTTGLGPDRAEQIIVGVLWVLAGLHLLVSYCAFSSVWLSEAGAEQSRALRDTWHAKRGRWWGLRRIFFFTMPAALLWSGRPELAAVYLIAFIFTAASRTYYRIALMESEEDGSPARVLKDLPLAVLHFIATQLWLVLFIPVVVTGVPALFAISILAYPIYYFMTQGGLTEIARNFVKDRGRTEGMIYFVYSEPHQRTHFLDGPGVLAPVRKWVEASDWRQDLSLLRRGKNFGQSPEGQFLGHFKISNLDNNLPFIAIINRKNRVKSFQCLEPYRVRGRDGGAALQALEEQIRSAAKRAFPD